MSSSFIKRIQNTSFLQWIFLGFVVTALTGVLLRYMQCFPVANVNYLFVMHGHSHFALSGWLFLAAVFLLAKQVSGNHLSFLSKAILISTIICAYGMLVSFFLYGYQLLSILFSTLFLVVGYWVVLVFYKKKYLEQLKKPIAIIFCKAGLWFLAISSIGPLLLGYLGATGFDNKVFLQNCVYFYLHFQFNGWLQLLLLALFFSNCLSSDDDKNNKIKGWVYIFAGSVIPVFLMFTLWSKPDDWFYAVATIGTALQMVSWFVILYQIKSRFSSMSFLMKTAFFAISVKVVLQVMVCVPAIGEWTFSNRNLIIAYLHLITLGALTPMVLDLLHRLGFLPHFDQVEKLHVFYVLVACFYLLILFGQPFLLLFGINMPYIKEILLLNAALLMLAGIRYFIDSVKS